MFLCDLTMYARICDFVVCGRDGRRPFPPDLEPLVVREIRKKETWPCFAGSTDSKVLNIGKKGFRHHAFHESLRASPATPVASIRTTLPKSTVSLNSFDSYGSFGSGDTRRSIILEGDVVNDTKIGLFRYFFDSSPPSSPVFGQPVDESGQKSVLGSRKSSQVEDYKAVSPPLTVQKKSQQERDREIEIKRTKRNYPTHFVNYIPDNTAVGTVYDDHTLLRYEKKTPLENTFDPAELYKDILTDESFITEALAEETWTTSVQPPIINPDATDVDLKFQMPELDFYSSPTDLAEYSILETFEDVSAEEVVKVVQLRNLAKDMFELHFAEQYGLLGKPTKEIDLPSNVCGDVKLLRTLRFCQGDVMQALDELKAFLAWRRRYGLEKVRQKLVSEDMCFKELKKLFTIGNRGGCYPFLTQEANGDITDLWVLREQTDEDRTEVMDDFYSHVLLNEFRSIVLDGLSRKKRRIVCTTVILDCSVMKDGYANENALDPASDAHTVSPGKKVVRKRTNWSLAFRTWGWYIQQLGDMATRWYGGAYKKVHVFGTGYLFRTLSAVCARRFFGGFEHGALNFASSPEENHQLLINVLGAQEGWPEFYGGNCKDPESSELTKMRLSRFTARNLNRRSTD